MNVPISPDVVRSHLNTELVNEAINRLVNAISNILDSPDAHTHFALGHGVTVTLVDDAWIGCHDTVIDLFRKQRWLVELIGHNYDRPIYIFHLPKA